MTCSSMHCYNQADQETIPVKGQWWVLIKNPAPFCAECKAKRK